MSPRPHQRGIAAWSAVADAPPSTSQMASAEECVRGRSAAKAACQQANGQTPENVAMPRIAATASEPTGVLPLEPNPTCLLCYVVC